MYVLAPDPPCGIAQSSSLSNVHPLPQMPSALLQETMTSTHSELLTLPVPLARKHISAAPLAADAPMVTVMRLVFVDCEERLPMKAFSLPCDIDQPDGSDQFIHIAMPVSFPMFLTLALISMPLPPCATDAGDDVMSAFR
jgi:hypothetical protein